MRREWGCWQIGNKEGLICPIGEGTLRHRKCSWAKEYLSNINPTSKL
jgi:hypothetical protein